MLTTITSMESTRRSTLGAPQRPYPSGDLNLNHGLGKRHVENHNKSPLFPGFKEDEPRFSSHSAHCAALATPKNRSAGPGLATIEDRRERELVA
jgi:hypothetical protein